MEPACGPCHAGDALPVEHEPDLHLNLQSVLVADQQRSLQGTMPPNQLGPYL